MKIAVLCWDLGHNALGRAHLLADMLAARHEVQIVGSHFPEFGTDVWSPLRDSAIPVRRYPATTLPEYFRTMERMASELSADVVYAVKPRLPSLGVGLLARSAGVPLVVDCDDLELAFVNAGSGLTLAETAARRDHPDFLRAEGRIWTRFCDPAVRWADAATAASVPLAARYRATVVPHARDEHVFDPAGHDRGEARAALGLGSDERAILFAGTPRRHKGIRRVAAALQRIGDRRNRLVVLATPEWAEVAPLLDGLERWVEPVPAPPFSRLPALLAAADVACVLQDPASESANWQMPAKVTDALAMGVPCLSSPVPPLVPLIDEGVVAPVEDDDDLVRKLERFLADAALRDEYARRGRAVFLQRYSYAAVRPRLERVIQGAAAGPSPPPSDLLSAVSFQRSAFAPGRPSSRAGHTATRTDQVARVRAAVEAALPAGAGPVAVVSRGDDELIRFEHHVGWHFPQDGTGAYAGYHPEDSDAAIRHLEEVRSRGARYLLVPASSAWWMDHYAGFRDHLASTYRPVAVGAGVRALVELVPEAQRVRAEARAGT